MLSIYILNIRYPSNNSSASVHMKVYLNENGHSIITNNNEIWFFHIHPKQFLNPPNFQTEYRQSTIQTWIQ